MHQRFPDQQLCLIFLIIKLILSDCFLLNNELKIEETSFFPGDTEIGLPAEFRDEPSSPCQKVSHVSNTFVQIRFVPNDSIQTLGCLDSDLLRVQILRIEGIHGTQTHTRARLTHSLPSSVWSLSH